MTLRQKLFVWNAAVIFAVGGVVLATVYLIVAHKLQREFFQFLTDEYAEGVTIVRNNAADPDALKQAADSEVKGGRYFPIILRIYDTRRDETLAVAATRQEWLTALGPDPRPMKQPTYSRTTTRPPTQTEKMLEKFDLDWDEANLRYGISPHPTEPEELHFLTGSPVPGQHPDLVLQVGLSYERVRLRLKSLRSYLIAGFALMVILSGTGGYLLTHRGLKPLRDISRSIERVSADTISRRLPETSADDEVGRITRSVNAMLGRIEEALQQMKNFTADAAHELRTPLSAARCRLEVAMEQDLPERHRGAIQDALDNLSGLNELINNLLLLANLDARPESYQKEDVELSSLLGDVGEFFQMAAEAKDVTFRTDYPDALPMSGNPELLRRLFSNLLQNAIRHCPSGGRLEVRGHRRENSCRVEVSNTGPVIDRQSLSHMFQRFYKADGARSGEESGYGLGLSICQKIVEVHGGLIRAESTEEDGTTIRVHLPLRG